MYKPIQVVWRIWFHIVIGLKSTFSYWLLVRDLSQQVDCSHSFTHASLPSIPSLNKHWWVNSFPYFEFLWLAFLQPTGENSTFKGVTWLSQVLQDNLHILRPTDLRFWSHLQDSFTIVPVLLFDWIIKWGKSLGRGIFRNFPITKRKKNQQQIDKPSINSYGSLKKVNY